MSFSNGAEPQEPQNSNWIFLQASDPTVDADIRNSSASRLTLRPDQDTKSPVGLESRLKYQFSFNAYRKPGEWHPPCILPLQPETSSRTHRTRACSRTVHGKLFNVPLWHRHEHSEGLQ